MKLSERQQLFALKMGELITWIYTLPGYGVVVGEVYRTNEMQKIYVKQGKSKTMNSKHLKCLAVDLNLFIDGKYITDKEAYRIIGEKWESLDSNCRWGGRFGIKKAKYKNEIGWDSGHFQMF